MLRSTANSLLQVFTLGCHVPLNHNAFFLVIWRHQTLMMGQEPRQTTSNIGHLNKPSIQVHFVFDWKEFRFLFYCCHCWRICFVEECFLFWECFGFVCHSPLLFVAVDVCHIVWMSHINVECLHTLSWSNAFRYLCRYLMNARFRRSFTVSTVTITPSPSITARMNLKRKCFLICTKGNGQTD